MLPKLAAMGLALIMTTTSIYIFYIHYSPVFLEDQKLREHPKKTTNAHSIQLDHYDKRSNTHYRISLASNALHINRLRWLQAQCQDDQHYQLQHHETNEQMIQVESNTRCTCLSTHISNVAPIVCLLSCPFIYTLSIE